MTPIAARSCTRRINGTVAAALLAPKGMSTAFCALERGLAAGRRASIRLPYSRSPDPTVVEISGRSGHIQQ